MEPELSVSIARRGSGHVLTCEQWVSAAPEECFQFFADAANLQALTPPFLEFRILTPMPVEMRPGALIEYRLGLLGMPLRWLTRIEAWEPIRGFTDVQLRGPYARWIHRHTFVPDDTGTWVCDSVEYALPLPGVSGPAHEWFVGPRLREIFEYRRDAVRRLLG